jgi:hypothetical protein
VEFQVVRAKQTQGKSGVIKFFAAIRKTDPNARENLPDISKAISFGAWVGTSKVALHSVWLENLSQLLTFAEDVIKTDVYQLNPRVLYKTLT